MRDFGFQDGVNEVFAPTGCDVELFFS